MYFTNRAPRVMSILFQSLPGTDDLMHSMHRLLQGGLGFELKDGCTHASAEKRATLHNANAFF